jgi:hypothetical protein
MKTIESYDLNADELIQLTKRKIPTIVGYDVQAGVYTIGDEARLTGLNGRTTVFNFKPAFGSGDKEFSGDKKYWYAVPSESRDHHDERTSSSAPIPARLLRTGSLASVASKPSVIRC